MGFFDFGGSNHKTSNRKTSNRKTSNRKTSNRKTSKNHSLVKNHKIVVGKIYADWCGACKQLQPNWVEMKNMINSENKDMFVFVEIEEKIMDSEIAKINEKYKKYKINLELQGGYPTIFKISDGKLEYYNGAREPTLMLEWFKWIKQTGGINSKKSKKSRKSYKSKKSRK